MASSFKDLKAWQKSMVLVQDIYRITRTFPKEETFGLTIQMRRAAVSIPSNIAEGKGRATNKDFVHFLHQARGSVLELETQVLIAHALGYLDKLQAQESEKQTTEVAMILNGLINSLSA